ncbi:MAG: hypothetical protein JNK15_09275 [Planctomycetes bacterium]|nr:hypothetical protein [Planctomycetota bacterium]
MTPRTVASFVALLLAGLGLQRPAAAQGDPAREIQEIARAIDEQLQEIDRLLLESGKKGQPRQKPKELLQQANEKSQSVEQGIETLIDKLQQMKNQGGGSGQPDPNQSPQDQQGQPEQQGQGQGKPQPGQGQRNRNENQTPDIAERQRNGQEPGSEPQGQQGQEGQKPGEQPGQQNQPGQQGQQGQEQPVGPDGKPLGGQETKDGGRNTAGNRQPEPDLGPGNRGQGEGSWGELQPYMNFLKNRGSAPPQVPEKFRKYYEAWLKQNPGEAKPNGAGPGGNGGKNR